MDQSSQAIAAAIVMDMSLHERKNINYANPSAIVPKPRCGVCLDLNFRAGIPPDEEVMHLANTADIANAAQAGCTACKVISIVLQMIFETYGNDLESRPSERKNIILQSLLEGGPLFISWSRTYPDGIGRSMNSIPTRIEIYTHSCEFCDGPPTIWPVVGRSREVSASSLSDQYTALLRQRPDIAESFYKTLTQWGDLAQKWLGECTTKHSNCRYEPKPLPTRVLYVGSEGVDPRLYITKREPAKYATLSHCWGGSNPLVTTTSTIEKWKKKIRLTDLPNTFRDAVTITRKLGLQYLWIDSLCIIQDNAEDWAREAARMGEVYENCYVMISADDSSNCQSGCLMAKPTPNQRSFNVDGCPCPGGSTTRIWFRLTNERNDRQGGACHRLWDVNVPDRNPLDNRGWALQERILAPRILHFGRREMAWECAEQLSCECQVSPNKTDMLSRFNAQLVNSVSPSAPGDSSGNHALENRFVWCNLVQEFTRRQLSRDTDRLPAISGLASRMTLKATNEYVCGLWRSKLEHLLLWESTNPDTSRRYKQYYAPSWSWASITGPVTYSVGPPLTDDSGKVQFLINKGEAHWEDDSEDHQPLLTILSVECLQSELNPFGPPRSASLTVRGLLAPAKFQIEQSSAFPGLPAEPELILANASATAGFNPDVYSENSLGADLFLLLVEGSRGVVLRRAGNDSKTYERVGKFDCWEEEELEEWRRLWTEQTVRII